MSRGMNCPGTEPTATNCDCGFPHALWEQIGRPLAEPSPPLVRRWNPWDIAFLPVVDTVEWALECTGMAILTARGSDRRRASLAATAGEPAYPLGPRFAGPRQGLAGGCAPCDPPNGNGT